MGKVKRSATVPASAAMATKVKRPAPAATEATTAVVTTPAAKGTAAVKVVIEIPSSPDYTDGSGGKKSRKRSAPPLVLDDEVEMWTPRQKRRLDEDCQILSGDPLASPEVVPSSAAAGNDDIEVVAERGKVACRDYPHPRSACARNPFNTTPHERHCDKCFCYVCDIAAPCVLWNGTGGHCHASDKDKRWKSLRFVMHKQKN